jgi:hypothetical protein
MHCDTSICSRPSIIAISLGRSQLDCMFRFCIHRKGFRLPSGTGTANHVEVVTWFWRCVWAYTVHEMVEDDKAGQPTDSTTILKCQLTTWGKQLNRRGHRPRDSNRNLLILSEGVLQLRIGKAAKMDRQDRLLKSTHLKAFNNRRASGWCKVRLVNIGT